MNRVRTLLTLGAVAGSLGLVGASQARLISGAVAGHLRQVKAPPARTQKPEITRQENYVKLLLLQESRSLRAEGRMLDQQDRALLRLVQLDHPRPITPQQQRIRARLLRHTEAQILSLQGQIDRTAAALGLQQAAITRSLSRLGSLVATNPGLAQWLLLRLQLQAATLQQAAQTLNGRSSSAKTGSRFPLTPAFPG
jgi:hypothetical protein